MRIDPLLTANPITGAVRYVTDARRKLALWRYDYNQVRPHSSLDNKTPAEARRALEQFEGSAHDALAQNEDEEYETQTRKLSL